MLIWLHEKSDVSVDTCLSQERASFSLSQGNYRSLDWNKDSSSAVDPRGSAFGVDNRGLGFNVP